ncbi:MAG: transcriptional repressor, partial [Verrucomicrobiota bacterium]
MACQVSNEDLNAIINGIIDRLREVGMRKTEALDALLHVMAVHHKPFSLAELAEIPELAGRDQATIYRLVTKLKEHGIVRQISLGNKGNCYQLHLPGHHHDYLICNRCGQVSEVPLPCVLKEVE